MGHAPAVGGDSRGYAGGAGRSLLDRVVLRNRIPRRRLAPRRVRGSTRESRMSWRIRGSYFESCNCDAICPCRRIDGAPGGRSTHGVCMGALSWVIEEGAADTLDLSGLPVALSVSYSDDEPGSPWTWFLYLPEAASAHQRSALEDIFTGRLGGGSGDHFPWAWKASNLVAVRTAAIEVSHEPRRQWLRVRDRVSVRIRDRYQGSETVTCVIPGHERTGEELVADEWRVAEAPRRFV